MLHPNKIIKISKPYSPIYNKLKDFLLNLKRDEWLYKHFEDHKNETEGFGMYATKSRLN